MKDIVERLREDAKVTLSYMSNPSARIEDFISWEAAEEIVKLRRWKRGWRGLYINALRKIRRLLNERPDD